MKTFYFRRNSDYDKEFGNKNWLHINNLGYYSNISKNISTDRSEPRADYHLLYVSKGEIAINGMTLKEGDAYLLLPNELHAYTYKKAENSRYYWVHFTGNKASDVLLQFGISNGKNKIGERKREMDTVFGMLTEELIGCTDEASDYAVSLFFSLLSLFKAGSGKRKIYAEAAKELEGSADVGIAEIAKQYGVSPSHFIRSFKAAYGVTPNEYRQNYRVSMAMNLLKMTNLSVQDIAGQCGFEDPLYFSRIFKKRIGVSPSVYRKGK